MTAAETFLTVPDALNLLVAEAGGAGADANSIATHLSAQGIVGWRKCAGSCPVSRWLERSTGERQYVGTTDVSGDDLTPDGWLLPAAVEKFVERFDNGWYPELVAPDPPLDELQLIFPPPMPQLKLAGATT